MKNKLEKLTVIAGLILVFVLHIDGNAAFDRS